MSNSKDWLQDPLMRTENGSDKRRKLKNPTDEKQSDSWWNFHFCTRLKLDGANFFCTKAIDTAHTSEDTKLEWYLDAFFFELMAAYDILLQELNIVYAYDLGWKPEKVRWNNRNLNEFMKKLPANILKNITTERRKDWLSEVQWFRNATTHHYRIPKSGGEVWLGHDSTYDVGLQYIDKEEKYTPKEIKICEEYLNNMVNYIRSVWQEMAQEFQ